MKPQTKKQLETAAILKANLEMAHRLEGMDLSSYRWIVVNSSAGKDSQSMLHRIHIMVQEQGIDPARVVVVHCDLGRVEWAGTKTLAEEQARHYGYRFECVSNPRDFLERVEARGQWPGEATRYCTSEFKTNQVHKLFTRLADEVNAPLVAQGRRRVRVRILNCLGIRAAESDKRALKPPFVQDAETRNGEKPNGRRQVDTWYPVFHWSTERVWDVIRASGVRYHNAYDLGMPRLSCVFCVFAPESALLIAGHHNRALLSEYVRLEDRMSHTFKRDLALITIQQKLESGYVPQGAASDLDWTQCA